MQITPMNEPSPPLRTVLRAGVLGALSGSRAATPLAHLASAPSRETSTEGPWPLLRARPVRLALSLVAIAERVLDKLPGTPSRLATPSLVGRIVSGSIVGGAVFTAGRRGLLLGAVIGGAAAYLGAIVGHRWRVRGGDPGTPHVGRGVLEDVVVGAISRRTARAVITS